MKFFYKKKRIIKTVANFFHEKSFETIFLAKLNSPVKETLEPKKKKSSPTELKLEI
jgi:hypothetical protein